jgi:hypothetical protein
MADASFVQDRFTGGEWSKFSQGRITDQRYRTAMQVCLNGVPMEEGAWARRPGTAFLQTTRSGAYGRVLPFDFNDTTPFNIEITQDHLRLFAGRSLVFDSVSDVVNVSDQNPAIVSISGGVSWATGDQVQFLFSAGAGVSNGAVLRNRVLAITILNDNQFTLTDPITGIAVNGADVDWDPSQVQAQVARVLDFTTAYQSGDLPLVRRVQAAGVGVNQSDVAILLSPKYEPNLLVATVNANSPTFSTFSYSPLAFQDGPYLDPPSGASLTISGTTSPVTVTIGYQAWSSTTAYLIGDFVTFSGAIYQSQTEGNINNTPNTSPANWTQVNNGAAVGPNGFQSTDVGRIMRMLSEPSDWNPGAGYSPGQAVKYNGVYYYAQQSNAGAQPDVSLDSWIPTTSTTIATWVWGRISAVNASNQAVVTLLGSQQSLLYNIPINTFRVGVYSNTTGWPACGAYYQGRLWLGGVVPNRFDASVSNDPFNFAPTAGDGAIGDANAIAEYFNSDEKNTIYWMEPTGSGLLCGTKKGEWLIAASNLKDPITPTSVQADRVTQVGCANVLPAHTPLTLVVVQRFQRLMFELFPDLFSGKLTAPNLNKDSKHLTTAGVAELAYQSELAPIVWGRKNDGSLIGWTYRRTTAQSAAPPEMVGGFRVTLGSGRTLTSVCVSSTPSTTSDAALMVTVDVNGVHHVEQLTRLLDPEDPLTASWFVDDAVTPSGMITDSTGVTFTGLWHLNGKTISAVVGGLDLGDYQIANGQVHIPYQGFFTFDFLQSLNGGDYGDLATTVNTTATTAAGSVTRPMTITKFQDPSHGDTVNPNIIKMDFANFSGWMQGSSAGLHKVSLQNFTETAFVNYATVAASGGGAGMDITTADWLVGLDGFIYSAQVGSNQSPWIKINPSTSTIVASYGVNSTFWSGGSTGFGRPHSMSSVQVGGVNYVVALNEVAAFQRTINWLNADTMQYIGDANGGRFDIEEGWGGIIVRGPSGPSSATVYCVSAPQTLNSGPDHVTIYQSSINGNGEATTSAVGVIHASDIDPQWTNINGISFAFDEKDGNLLVTFTSGSFPVRALNHPNYIAKLRASDFSIVWKVALGSVPALINSSRAAHSVLSWIGESSSPGNRYIYSLNTVDGSYTRFIVNNTSGNSLSDDTTGIVYAFASYAKTGDANSPNVGPNTPATFSGFAALTAGNIFQGSTTSTSSMTVPAVLGFTYTSQGQIVRPALPAEAGAQNGPAQGKTRRSHMFSLLAAAAIYGSISMGTVFGKLRPVNFKQPNEQPYDTKTLFSGVHWGTLEDNYSFEGGLAWEITRPLPASISSVGGFINTQDR